MTSFASASRQLLHRLLGGRPSVPPADGRVIVRDGVTAVSMLEARICEATAGGAWGEPDPAETTEWAQSSLDTQTVRASLAAAIGLAASGQRACAFLDGPEVAASGDLLAQAAGQRVPLVAHVAAQAMTRHGRSAGHGHEALHAIADSGCVILIAGSVQEAIDLGVIGRMVAERALVPVVIAQDRWRTAFAPQDVIVPGEALLHELLGGPADRDVFASPEQQILEGRTRRRIPRRFDLDHPNMLTPSYGGTTWGLAAAAGEVAARRAVSTAWQQACTQFAARTGRQYGSLRTGRVEKATVVLVAQGAAVETALAVAEACRHRERIAAGVIGVRSLRPFPSEELAACLPSAATVAVLESVSGSLATEGPLLREVRAVVGRAAERRDGRQRGPRCVGVTLGPGGGPVRAADLRALLRELAGTPRAHVYLGLPFVQETSYPKRQSLLNALQREDADLAARGLCAAEPAPDVRPREALTIALQRPPTSRYASLPEDSAGLLHALRPGRVRVRPAQPWDHGGAGALDLLTLGDGALLDPGDDVVADIGVLIGGQGDGGIALADRLRPGGMLVCVGAAPERTPELHARIRAKELLLFHTPATEDTHADDPVEALREAALGGIAAMLRQTSFADVSKTRLERARAGLAPAGNDGERLAAYCAEAADKTVPVDAEALQPAPPAAPAETPGILRDRPAAASEDPLVQFWNHVGVLYRDGRTAELTADPVMAAGSVPALSAALRHDAAAPQKIVAFDAAQCSGHGHLWSCCPDGSVTATAIGLRPLLSAGIAQAGVDDLQPLAGPLAKAAHAEVTRGSGWSGTAGDLFRGALAEVARARKLDDARREALAAQLEAVLSRIGPLRLARTAPFFDRPEAGKRGSGELLALAVDPDRCRCPDLLLRVGHGGGLVEAEATHENVAAARAQVRLLESLPATSNATIARVAGQAEIGPLAAALLSRECRDVQSGGDSAEPGSGVALALRQVLALTEHNLHARQQAWLEQVESLGERLAERIRGLLADALPTGDLDALADGLESLGRGEVDLAALSQRVEGVVHGGHVDGVRLSRLVECARGLADLRWRLVSPEGRLRRARFGLVIASERLADSHSVFPHNPFDVPVAVEPGSEAGAAALGLLEGQVRQMIAAVRLLRWARLELERPAEAEDEVQVLARLQWSDLSPEERGWCPPLLVVSDDRSFGGLGPGQLAWLLETRLPLKFVVLGEAGFGTSGPRSGGPLPVAENGWTADLMSILFGCDALVAQTSPAVPGHLADCVRRALASSGPAVLRVHAPRPRVAGFRPEQLFMQLERAIRTRVFPLFRYEPGGSPASLDLSGNDAATEDWPTGCNGRCCTPADWAVHQARFARWFAPLPPDAATPTLLADYLALAEDERATRTPTIDALRDGTLQHLRVDPELVAASAKCLETWRALRRRAEARRDATDVSDQAAEADQVRLAQLRADYERQLLERERTWKQDTTERVTERLLAMAGYGAGRTGKMSTDEGSQ